MGCGWMDLQGIADRLPPYLPTYPIHVQYQQSKEASKYQLVHVIPSLPWVVNGWMGDWKHGKKIPVHGGCHCHCHLSSIGDSLVKGWMEGVYPRKRTIHRDLGTIGGRMGIFPYPRRCPLGILDVTRRGGNRIYRRYGGRLGKGGRVHYLRCHVSRYVDKLLCVWDVGCQSG